MSGPLALVYPVLAQVLLTLVMLAWRVRARIADVALPRENWLDDVRQTPNTHSRFETQLLFYVLCAVATYITETGVFMVLLAWIYVASSVIHAVLQVTTDRIRHRFLVFALGFLALCLMWVLIVARLLLPPVA